MVTGALSLFSNAYRDAADDALMSATAEVDRLLSEKKILFLSGKGGTGKSTVAGLLALRARALGLTPLVFECDAPSRPSLFVKGERTRNQISEVSEGIYALNQPSEDAIRAYAAAALPNKKLADLLLENRVSRLFLNAAPSVSEMALVGRVVQLSQQADHAPIIVDLHSTGHALHILRAPEGIMRVLRSGPVFERAKLVQETLYDPERVALIPVALPEELPVTETIEFVSALKQMNVPLGPVVVNALFNDPVKTSADFSQLPESLSPLVSARASVRQWALRHKRERGRLADSIELPLFDLPYLSDIPVDSTLAQTLYDVTYGVDQ